MICQERYQSLLSLRISLEKYPRRGFGQFCGELQGLTQDLERQLDQRQRRL